MAEFNSADIAIIAIFTISCLIGIYRGFLREIISFFTWIIAFVVAFLHGKTAGQIFTFVDSPSIKRILGMVLIFVSVVVGAIIAKFFIFRSMNVSKPSALGRIFGALYGAGRATLIVVLGLLFLTTEKIEAKDLYQNSQLIPKFNVVVDYLDIKLPSRWNKKAPATETTTTGSDVEVQQIIVD